MIFIDTTIFVAAADKSDRYHDPSKEILIKILNGKLPLALTTDYVLNETFTILGKRTGVKKVVEIIKAIRASTRIRTIFVDEDLFSEILSKAERLPEGLSLTDVASVVLMEKYKIREIYSHDKDFDKISNIVRKEKND